MKEHDRQKPVNLVAASRAVVLQLLFAGDPRAWLDYLERWGSPEQKRDDLPFVRCLVERTAGWGSADDGRN